MSAPDGHGPGELVIPSREITRRRAHLVVGQLSSGEPVTRIGRQHTKFCFIPGSGRAAVPGYDAAAAQRAGEEHGVDFVQAQELWQDPMHIEVPARTTGEPRWLVVGRMGGRHWSAVVTYREDRVRIISVRRARDEEIRIYEV